MRRRTTTIPLLALGLLAVLVQPSQAHEEPLRAYEDWVVFDDAAAEATFTILFELDPTAALANSDGFRAELNFQYWLYLDGIDDGASNSDRIVSGRLISATGEVTVQDTGPPGTGPGGWGTERGRVAHTVTETSEGFLVQTTVAYALLDDDGRFAYDLITTEFGATRYRSAGTSAEMAPTARVTVSPDHEISGGDTLRISMTGFAPSTEISWSQCQLPRNIVATANCDEVLGSGVTDATGTFEAPPHRFERFMYLSDAEGFFDCAEPQICAIVATDADGTRHAAHLHLAPLPPEPAARGQITVVEERARFSGDTLTVEGSGFRPNTVIELRQCLDAPNHPGDCTGLHPLAAVTSDGAGDFTSPVMIGREGAPQPLFFRWDCFDLDGCVIAASEATDFATTVATTPLVGPIRPEMRGGGASVVEGDTGTIQLRIPVLLSESTTIDVSARWYTFYNPDWSSLAATPGDDYLAGSGFVTVTAGESEGFITVDVVGDIEPEQPQLIAVQLWAPDGATISGWDAVAFGGIIDDEGAP